MREIVDVSRLDFQVLPPQELDLLVWRDIQTLQRIALSGVLPYRSSQEISYALDYGFLDEYINARLDPKEAVNRGHLHIPQNYAQPLIALAYHESRLVGYVYSADRTLGRTARTREYRMQKPAAREAWFWEAAVAKDYQDKGIAHILGWLSLQERDPQQPVVAEAWGELPEVMILLRNLDFVTPVGRPDYALIFGPSPDIRRVEEWRFVAESVDRVMRKIEEMPGMAEAVKQAAAKIEKAKPQRD